MFLDAQIFSSIIKNTPLISIDLIVKNLDNKVLLGKRVNEPARGNWFVPGGRVFKDETLDDAFKRIVKSEIGYDLCRAKAKFYGTYEHFYKNNVFNDEFGTHYVVLAYEICLDDVFELNDQHEEYRYFSVDELLDDDMVHKYTKDYFMESKT